MDTLVKDDLSNPNNSHKKCFVCDVPIIGKYYSLATCRTNNTKIRIIEKLGQMVGDKYMIIISDQDLICDDCANLINTLERVEIDVVSFRGVLLRFLEKKYKLEEGELTRNKFNAFTETTPNGSGKHAAKGRPNNESFMSRKRKAALNSNLDFENDQENTSEFANRSDRKSNEEVWMQCDKCKYSTPYNTFLNNHINHIPKNPSFSCTYCHVNLKDCNCAKNGNKNKPNFLAIETKESSIQLNEENSRIENVTHEETVELITAEINDYNRTNAESNTLMIPCLQENNTRNQNETFILQEFPSNCSQPLLINSQPVSGEEINHNIQQNEVKNICESVQDSSQSSNHPLFSNTKFSEDDNNSVFVQVQPNSDNLSSMTKQVLTVSEDGSVEMVEVVWDELLMSGQESLTF